MSSRRLLSVAVFTALMALRCSGDDEADTGGAGAQGLAGSAGAPGAASGAGGMASAGSSTGGSSTGGSSAAGSGTAAGGAAAGMPSEEMPAGSSDELAMVSFETDVWPVLREHCQGAGCHGDGSFLPEHANADVNVAFDEAAPVADKIIGRVSGQLTPIMPQGCGPAPGFGTCLSLDEVALIRAWVEQGAPF